MPNTPRTPSSTSWVSARTPTSNGSTKTPHSNGSAKTPHSTNARTPTSSTSSKTPNSNGCARTPSSGTASSRSASSGSRSVKTLSSSSSSTRWNPFDSQHSVDMMLHPTLSPNVFSTVISPSQDTESSTGRFWSIDQQAEMFPTTISDDSPLKQSIYVKNYSKDLENKTQEQIELYFAEHHAITSPQTCHPQDLCWWTALTCPTPRWTREQCPPGPRPSSPSHPASHHTWSRYSSSFARFRSHFPFYPLKRNQTTSPTPP